MNKYLSFSCSPGRDYIEVTKKISLSLFSQSLINLKKGDDVLINGPFGNCVFKPEYKKIAFLVGGVGITPVISILEYIYENRFPTDAVLIYSNKTEDIAFKKELDSFAENRENIRVFYTVSDYEPKNKNHIFGIINKNLILRKVEDFANRVFFIFGPPAMVKAMGDICFNSGCTKERLRIENFIGY